jgi:two-component system, chemotaxis family, chemotaxis protein CheY
MLRVLIADDAPTIRAILADIIRTLGPVHLVEAEDGGQALIRFGQHQPDLVLTDWQMPRISGLEVVRAIRSIDSQVPIIMVTSVAEKDQIVGAVEAGANDYIIKPFKIDLLKKKIWHYIDQVAAGS